MMPDTFKDCPKCGGDHKGKPFAVYEDGVHCFSCGYHKSSDILHIRPTVSNNIKLPKLITNPAQFSVKVLKYLYQYNITDSDIRKYRISEASNNSYVFPLMEGNEIVWFQRRWVEERKIYSSGKRPEFLIENFTSSVVLVEDPISAIRVGKYVDCYCMFGTSAKYSFLKYLIQKYDNIIVWCDNDSHKSINSGQIEAAKLIKKCKKIIDSMKNFYTFDDKIYDKNVYNLVTESDPKHCSDQEIRRFIYEE